MRQSTATAMVSNKQADTSATARALATGKALLLCALVLLSAGSVRAQSSGGVLAECAALSALLDDIHTCLDAYLTVMDERLLDIAALVDQTLEGEARAAFEVSQQAFDTYRRENCLWYLAFSTPRSEAEQIGKDCLATMSLQRLSELQRLLTNRGGDAPKTGYYVYGADRNTFRTCGSEARYWVEGDASVVGELQQRYLGVAAEERQVLYASLAGRIEEGLVAPAGHSGVFRATDLLELRVPREGDCRLPAGAASLADERASTPPPAVPEASLVNDPPPAPAAEDLAEQQLTAYFGAWLADCTERSGSRVCLVSTTLDGSTFGDASLQQSNGLSSATPVLALTRRDAGRTDIELAFPGREVDSPSRLRWSVDGDVFGDIIGSEIRVDERASRQIVGASSWLDNELLPLLINGGELAVDVLLSPDDAAGERFTATLMGLTRALGFADEFVQEGEGL